MTDVASAAGALVLRYEWGSPPIATPWSYEITLWPGVGELAVAPGGGGPGAPRWAATFAVPPEAASGLLALLHESGLLAGRWARGEQPVGGDSHRLVVWIDGAGTTWPYDLDPSSAAQVRRVGHAVRSLVPDALWASMEARRAAHR